MSSRLPYERTELLDQTGGEPADRGSIGSVGQPDASAAADERSTASTATVEGKRVAETATEGAKQVAQEATTQARETVREAGTQLRALAGEGRDQLRAQAEQQTHRASQNLRTLADQAHALADGRVDQAGPLGDRVRHVAAQLSRTADRLERRGFDGVLADVTAFARRRPAAFIGLTTLAGFAVSRIGRNLTGSGDDDNVGRGPGYGDRERLAALPARVSPGSLGGSSAGYGVGYGVGSEPPAYPATEPIVPGMSADVVVDEEIVLIRENDEPENGRP